MLIEFLNGIICGFGIVIARFYGAEDEKGMQKAIGVSVVLSTAITIVISGLCLLFLPQVLALLNVGLDYTLIVYGRMGVSGAAAATVAAQAVSALLCFLYMRKKYPQLRISVKELIPDRNMCKELFPTGMSMGFMISFVTLGSVALQTGINMLGTNIIVAHTAARKVTMIFLIPFFVLGTALATYCGQNLGAGDYGRIKKGIRDTIFASFTWCVVVLLAVFLFAPKMVQAITASSEPEMVKNATQYLQINSVFYFLPAIICILRNSMQGFGDNKTPLVSSVIELIGKVLVAFLLVPVIGYMGVIVSEPLVWIVMVIPLLISIRRRMKQ